jgi:hypothetical protein
MVSIGFLDDDSLPATMGLLLDYLLGILGVSSLLHLLLPAAGMLSMPAFWRLLLSCVRLIYSVQFSM